MKEFMIYISVIAIYIVCAMIYRRLIELFAKKHEFENLESFNEFGLVSSALWPLFTIIFIMMGMGMAFKYIITPPKRSLKRIKPYDDDGHYTEEYKEVILTLNSLGFSDVINCGDQCSMTEYLRAFSGDIFWILVDDRYKLKWSKGLFYYWEDKWIPCDPSITDIPTLMVLYAK